ncbi:hypothetical protein C8Q70DRAFT_335269 [Cubamyces menziesii]|nr:hypothetical protein C8Q70DRAFT_335269 [Cubamyces menziesii]
MADKSCKHYTRKCNHCYASSTEKKLFFCSRCKAQTYCSRECQKADWKSHKGVCMTNDLLESLLRAHENSPQGQRERLGLVDGLSLRELDQRLEKWVRWHTLTLMTATVHALRLPESLARARAYVLYIRLEARPQAEHNGAPAKFFRVRDAEVVSVEEGMRRPLPWPWSLLQLRQLQDEAERSGRGGEAAAMVECPPLGVQTVPFGSLRDLGDVVQEDWKEFLVHHVEQGRKPRMLHVH